MALFIKPEDGGNGFIPSNVFDSCRYAVDLLIQRWPGILFRI
jgi:hypothetical protein